MQRKRTIKADDIIRDLRSGMTVSQLIDKNNISLRNLRFVFQRLLNAGMITKEELNAQPALYRDIADLQGVRNRLRTTTTFPARIYDCGSPFATGFILDISEQGVCVKGIETVVGEVKDFIVRTDAFEQGQKLVFEGKCRWLNKEKLSVKEWMAGFEITEISSLDLAELRKLVSCIDERESLGATFSVIY
jgi:hypothetical protein